MSIQIDIENHSRAIGGDNMTKEEFDNLNEEWFTVDDIEEIKSEDKLYCISVDSPEKQFLIGELGIPTHNTDEAKEADELKGEAIMIIVRLDFPITA